MTLGRMQTARTVTTLAAAVGQIVLPSLILPRLRRDLEPPDVVQPAAYTFAVWLPVYAVSLGTAVQQARRPGAVPPEVGWPLLTGFASTSVWAPLLRGGHYWGAQAALAGIGGFSELARTRVAAGHDQLDPSARALLVATTGMLAGWGTAATAVNLAAMLVAYGPNGLARRRTAVGVVTALGVGALAGARTRATGGVDPTSRTYAATVLWALAGIVAGKRRTSPAVAAAAGVASVQVLLAALRSGSGQPA